MSNRMATLPSEDLAFHVERHGIDFIPETERWATPRAVASMWAGASVNIEYVVYGAILATFGFSFAQCVLLIVVGNLSWFLVGLTSLQGPLAGTTTFSVNRAPFGPNGSRVIAACNWLTQVGFEIEGIILIVGAGVVLGQQGGIADASTSTAYRCALIVLAVAIQAVLPFFGHATMVRVLRLLLVPFVLMYLVLAGVAAGHAHLGTLTGAGVSWQLWTQGLAFTITLSGLGWTENGNDYSRYLPPDARGSRVVGWLFCATALPEIALMVLGTAMLTFIGTGTGFSSSWDGANPFSAFLGQHALPHWFVSVFMCFVVVQLFSINSLDLYSSGVTLQAVGLRIRRYQAVLLDSVICLGFTFYAVFDSRFSTLLGDFVKIVIVWIAPWCGIYLVDWWLRKRRTNALAVQLTDRTSPYWASGGVHWPALLAQVLGSLAALQGLNAGFLPTWLNALSSHHGQLDLSVFLGLGVGGAAYALLGARSVGRLERFLTGGYPVSA